MSIINNDIQAVLLLTLPLVRSSKDEYPPPHADGMEQG